MRVAALYDIHGNLPALEAVMREVRQAQVDQIVVGGDIFPGPMPRETLKYLLDLDIPVQFIHGNCERELLTHIAGRTPDNLSERYRTILSWHAQQLQPEDQQLLSSWQSTLTIEIDGLGKVLFCHATPRDDNEIFTSLTPEERLLPVFAGLDAAVVVCGHTHMQFDRMVGNIRVVNAGSIGMPFGEPGAYWLLLGRDVEFRHTMYDLKQAAELVRGTDYPQAQEFADDILQPSPAAEMLELYTKNQLK